ncbi:hypothetical protein CTAYLR_001361 [Chrysophaeum taylorii]|uniref:ABC transporter domain-containing protein n=1 Tax=Chrysophaeum taylorii TaxID=2483200 RepID=A0AAD7U5B1_9STRA|nr:hypothetical protein CTAYLR_001361 [Chrysophaeum taylorii]
MGASSSWEVASAVSFAVVFFAACWHVGKPPQPRKKEARFTAKESDNIATKHADEEAPADEIELVSPADNQEEEKKNVSKRFGVRFDQESLKSLETGGYSSSESKSESESKSKQEGPRTTTTTTTTLPEEEEEEEEKNCLFESRRGPDLKFEKVTVVGKDRKILDGVYGEVKHGKICAVFGPSGCGKTTLLNVLGGRQASRPGLSVETMITLDRKCASPAEYFSAVAYVMQEDAIAPLVTPREAISFSALLRRPRLGTEARDRLVETLVAELGLEACADLYVGGSGTGVKGISGGQRKRAAIAVELVTSPTLVFLDEPTSGLDAESAFQCVATLGKVASAGSSVAITIHQPASDVFAILDNILLMKKGRVVHFGPRGDLAETFASRGYPNPPDYNLADHVVKVASTADDETLERAGFFFKKKNWSEARPTPLHWSPSFGPSSKSIQAVAVASDLFRGMSSSEDKNNVEFERAPAISQFLALLDRTIKLEARHRPALVSHVLVNLFIFTLVGVVYYRSGESDLSRELNLSTHNGALTLVSIASLSATATPILLSLANERPMFVREYLTWTYSATSYVLSKVVVNSLFAAALVDVTFLSAYLLIDLRANFFELAFYSWLLSVASSATAFCLSAVSPDAKTATELFPIIFSPQYLFSGFFVRINDIPPLLRWARFTCSLKYALNLISLAEFSDSNCEKHTNDKDLARSMCKDLKKSNSVDAQYYLRDLLILLSFFVGLYALSGYILKKKSAEAVY